MSNEEKDLDLFRDRVKAILAEQELTQKAFEQQHGLSRGLLTRLFGGRKKMDLETLEEVATGLGVPPIALVEGTGFAGIVGETPAEDTPAEQLDEARQEAVEKAADEAPEAEEAADEAPEAEEAADEAPEAEAAADEAPEAEEAQAREPEAAEAEAAVPADEQVTETERVPETEQAPETEEIPATEEEVADTEEEPARSPDDEPTEQVHRKLPLEDVPFVGLVVRGLANLLGRG